MPRLRTIGAAEREKKRISVAVKTVMAMRDVDSLDLSQRLGMDYQYTCRRVRGDVPWTLTEISSIVYSLHLSDNEILFIVRGKKLDCS